MCVFVAGPEGTDSDGRLSTVAASDPTAKPPRAGCFAGAAASAARTTGVCVLCAFIAVLPMCASVQCVFRSTTYTVLTQTQDFVRLTERSRKGHPSASHQPHTRRRPVRGSIADWARRASHRAFGRLASVIRVPRGGPILAIAARGTSPRKLVPQVISRSSSTSVTTS